MKKNQQSPYKMTDHHIFPYSRGGEFNPQNIKRVPHKPHDAFHQVFGNLTPAEIFDYLNEVWFDPKTPFISPQLWLWEKD